ncbi:Fatty-acyl-CoA desaturase [Operophtera brumata]|uniref:Fatty-acyl-CoA desaturase n=1 Tax=Operophtera brumata TaxID=104452 RepID=A0A0L7L2Z9_OPEBR|nr:Fatty-acyl-CoA desaturase [Operophtera brumata]
MYRNSAHSTTGREPAVAMFGRRLRGRIDLLRADPGEAVRNTQLQQEERAVAARPLRVVAPGDPVLTRDYSARGQKWTVALFGVVMERTGPVSYKVKAMDKRVHKCHVDQLLADRSVSHVSRYLMNALWLILLVAFIIPSVVPLIWNETFTVAYHMNLLRVTLVLNASCIVNSIAHMWGTRTYDKTILPVQNKIVSFFALGEGFHNYHHVFPHDYRTAEFGDNFLNLTTKFIDFCARIGQAYDRRYVPDDVIAARIKRTGEKN